MPTTEDHDKKGQFVKGNKASPPKGSDQRRKTKELSLIFAEYGYDPAVARLEFRKRLIDRAEDFEKLAKDLSDDDENKEKFLTQAHVERLHADKLDSQLMDYIYPKRKAVEIAGVGDEPLSITVNLFDPHVDE